MLGGKRSLEFGNPKNQPKKGSAAFNRNQIRLNTRNDADKRLLSKLYLPNDLSAVFNPPVSTPDDEKFVPLDWFLAAIKIDCKDTNTNTKASTLQILHRHCQCCPQHTDSAGSR